MSSTRNALHLGLPLVDELVQFVKATSSVQWPTPRAAATFTINTSTPAAVVILRSWTHDLKHHLHLFSFPSMTAMPRTLSKPPVFLTAMRAPRLHQAGEIWLPSAFLLSAVTPSGTRPMQIETADHVSSLLFCVNSFIFCFPPIGGCCSKTLTHVVLAIV